MSFHVNEKDSHFKPFPRYIDLPLILILFNQLVIQCKLNNGPMCIDRHKQILDLKLVHNRLKTLKEV